jgi:hypothetical protein
MQLIRIEHSTVAEPDHLFYQPPPGSLSCLHSLIIHDFSSHAPVTDKSDHTKPKLKSFTFNKETQYKLLSLAISHPNQTPHSMEPLYSEFWTFLRVRRVSDLKPQLIATTQPLCTTTSARHPQLKGSLMLIHRSTPTSQ